MFPLPITTWEPGVIPAQFALLRGVEIHLDFKSNGNGSPRLFGIVRAVYLNVRMRTRGTDGGRDTLSANTVESRSQCPQECVDPMIAWVGLIQCGAWPFCITEWNR